MITKKGGVRLEGIGLTGAKVCVSFWWARIGGETTGGVWESRSILLRKATVREPRSPNSPTDCRCSHTPCVPIGLNQDAIKQKFFKKKKIYSHTKKCWLGMPGWMKWSPILLFFNLKNKILLKIVIIISLKRRRKLLDGGEEGRKGCFFSSLDPRQTDWG